MTSQYSINCSKKLRYIARGYLNPDKFLFLPTLPHTRIYSYVTKLELQKGVEEN
jgi:hypothetical protein